MRPSRINAVLATALLVLSQVALTSGARGACITVEDVKLKLGQPSAHLLQEEVGVLSRRYEAIHGKPFAPSDEALVYEDYIRGTSAAVRVILFKEGCGHRDGGMPLQVYDVMTARIK